MNGITAITLVVLFMVLSIAITIALFYFITTKLLKGGYKEEDDKSRRETRNDATGEGKPRIGLPSRREPLPSVIPTGNDKQELRTPAGNIKEQQQGNSSSNQQPNQKSGRSVILGKFKKLPQF